MASFASLMNAITSEAERPATRFVGHQMLPSYDNPKDNDTLHAEWKEKLAARTAFATKARKAGFKSSAAVKERSTPKMPTSVPWLAMNANVRKLDILGLKARWAESEKAVHEKTAKGAPWAAPCTTLRKGVRIPTPALLEARKARKHTVLKAWRKVGAALRGSLREAWAALRANAEDKAPKPRRRKRRKKAGRAG